VQTSVIQPRQFPEDTRVEDRERTKFAKRSNVFKIIQVDIGDVYVVFPEEVKNRIDKAGEEYEG
jgi:hypothetical protein